MRPKSPGNADEYDKQVTRLQREQDWEALARYCRSVERQIAKAIRNGAASQEEQCLRIQALSDLQAAYSILGMPQQQLKAAQEAHRARQSGCAPSDDLSNYYSYTALARAHQHNGQMDQGREMLLRSITSLLSKQQAEFVANALLELTELEREANEPAAFTLTDAAAGIKRAARRTHRKTP